MSTIMLIIWLNSLQCPYNWLLENTRMLQVSLNKISDPQIVHLQFTTMKTELATKIPAAHKLVCWFFFSFFKWS